MLGFTIYAVIGMLVAMYGIIETAKCGDQKEYFEEVIETWKRCYNGVYGLKGYCVLLLVAISNFGQVLAWPILLVIGFYGAWRDDRG